MKRKESFILRNIAGEYIMMPVGDTALKFSGLIRANEVSGFIWEHIEEADCPEKLADMVCAQFEVGYEEALKDVSLLLGQMEQAGWIE